MVVKVFLLGRPGSGKTSAFQYFEMLAHDKGRRATRFREYAILYEMFQDGRSEFQPAEHGGFDIRDFSVLNESAQHLEERVQAYLRYSAQQDELIFLELARDDYKTAMRCFSADFLQNAYFLFVDASVETCIERIHWRVAHPATTDGHFVSEHILRSYYAQDNKAYMATHFQTDYGIQKCVEVIENTGSFDEFVVKLKPFADAIFAGERADKPEPCANGILVQELSDRAEARSVAVA